MDVNPVLKPKLATPALILGSVAILVCVVSLVGFVAAYGQAAQVLVVATAASLLLATGVGAIWLMRVRRLHAWTTAARKMWNHLDTARRTRRTTTEVTLLGVDALQPTGSWITIRWNRFNYVQQAWIETVPEPIWPGSVLLISPDPAQITPGAPWPATYYIRAADCLAWAPADARKKSHPPEQSTTQAPIKLQPSRNVIPPQ